MKVQKLLKSFVLTTAILALALAPTADAGGKGKGNPFKKKGKPPKTHVPKKTKKFDCKPPPVQTTPTTYSGQAVAVDLTNGMLGLHWVVGNTGQLPSAGGSVNLTVGATNLPGIVNVGMAQVSISGSGGVSTSQAQVQGFTAVFVHGSVTNTISFDTVQAIAEARCTTNGIELSAGTQIQGLVINGVSIVTTGAVNQVISVPGGTIVLNAQLTSTSTNYGEISAAAIFVDLVDCFSGVIAFAKADISCGGTNQPPGGEQPRDCGKITGGGFIVGTPSGAHGSFGVSGGIRRGEYWGHLNYIDHGTGMHVRSTAVTGFGFVDAVTRQITYNVVIGGSAGTATVIVSDNGEPGRNDIFDITLSTGYHAGGDLGGPGSGGGNIQLHKCPPGWAR